jgi:hypothetical protein
MAARPFSLPLLSWEFVVIQVADTSRVMDPVLAFARDQTIHFFQVQDQGFIHYINITSQFIG